MSFDIHSLVKIGGQNQSQSIFTYITDDTRAAVESSGYFDDAFGALREDDYIIVRNTNEDYQLRVMSQTKPITTELLFRMTEGAQTTGWVQITDTTYTDVSPFAVLSGVRTKLDLNSDAVIETYAPPNTTADFFYDPTLKRIETENVGDAYLFRLNMKIDPAQTNGAFDLELDIGDGSEIVILERATTLSKGTSTFTYTTTNLYYSLGTFAANGGEFYVTPTVNIDIYDMSLVITRVHKAG